MKPGPPRGPIMRRSSQKAREAISSRNSLARRKKNRRASLACTRRSLMPPNLREGKEDLLQPGVGRVTQTGNGAQFGKRAHAHHTAAAEQHRSEEHTSELQSLR